MADFSDVVAEIKKTNQAIGKLIQATDPKGAAAAEDKRDAANAAARSEGYLETIARAVSGAGGKGDGLDPKDKKKGGLLAGIGGAMGSMGIGAGVAMGGLGALFAGGGYLLKQIAEFDGKAVVENVKHLMSIGKLFDGPWDALKEGGAFFLVMTGLGAGIAAFALGSGVAAAVSYFTQKTPWAQDIYDNVKTLISIKDIKGYDKFSPLGFAATMTAIAAGIVAFSIAGGIAGLSKALTRFTDTSDWAQDIYDNVETLVSIQFIKGYDTFKATEFAGTMLGISTGLIAFSIGEAVASTTQALARFLDSTNWAQVIHNNVETLIGIQNIKGYDSFKKDKFLLTMGAISLGLIAFSIGEAVASTTQALTRFLDSTNWAEVIYDNVETLIGIQNIKGYDTFGKAGFLLTMGAISLGLIAFSIGEVVASTTQALTRFLDSSNWAQSIHDNVKTLISIQNIKGYNTFDKTNFLLTMGAIALGMIAFALGEGATGMAQSLTKFTDITPWAQSIYDNVKTLVSIQNITGYNTFDKTNFLLTMGAIALGLIAFALGESIKGVVQSLTKFADVTPWAQTIYDNVKTLVSIQFIKGYDSFGKVGFVLTMGAIALGLIAFALGEGATGIAQSLTKFADVKPWAQSIYDNVATLISIMTIPNIGEDTKKFLAVMTGLAAGLFVFAIGKGANVMGDALSKFTGNFADNIKKDVTTLISILGDPNVNVAKSIEFTTILGNISTGLMKLAGGTFISSLAGAGSKILNFLSGDDSPIQEVMKLAAKSKELKEGAEAIGKIGEGLDKMAGLKFDGSDINIKEFAEDLKKSIPVIEAAIMGSTEGIFWKTKIKGLASTEIKWDEAAKNIKTLREALGVQVTTDMGGMGGGAGKQQAFRLSKVNKLYVNTLIAQKLISRAVEKSVAGQGGNNFQDNSTTAFDNSQRTSVVAGGSTPLADDSLAGKMAKAN